MTDRPRLLTAQEIEAIAQRERDATKGPWAVCPADKAESPWILVHGEGDSLASFEPMGMLATPKSADADVAFTAHARTDIPALLASHAAQAAMIAERDAEIEQLQQTNNRVVELYNEASAQHIAAIDPIGRPKEVDDANEWNAIVMAVAEKIVQVPSDRLPNHARDVESALRSKCAADVLLSLKSSPSLPPLMMMKDRRSPQAPKDRRVDHNMAEKVAVWGSGKRRSEKCDRRTIKE